MSDKKLILLPSALAQWQSLLQEAQQAKTFYLSEELESYLAFLLMRFINANSISDTVLGKDFLGSLQHPGSFRYDRLRDVGDKCLLFSGLFPGNAQRRQVDLQYFVDLGQTAYSTVAENTDYEMATLFDALCQEFENLTAILRAMRELHQPDPLFQKLQDTHTLELSGKPKKIH